MFLKEKELAIENKNFNYLTQLIEADIYWSLKTIDNSDNIIDQLNNLCRYARENGQLLAKACYALGQLCLERGKQELV